MKCKDKFCEFVKNSKYIFQAELYSCFHLFNVQKLFGNRESDFAHTSQSCRVSELLQYQCGQIFRVLTASPRWANERPWSASQSHMWQLWRVSEVIIYQLVPEFQKYFVNPQLGKTDIWAKLTFFILYRITNLNFNFITI